MGVLNGQSVDEDFTNPAFLDRRQDDTAFGVYDFDNTTDPLSGPIVSNLQRHINEGHQDEKSFIITATGQKITWTGTTLQSPENLLIVFRDTGFVNTILAASIASLPIADGESAYVTVNRYANANVTINVTSSLPKGKDIYRICSRVGSLLVFRDNTVFLMGASAFPGATGGVTSVGITGDADLTGDVDLEEGSNVSLTRVGNTIFISALGGGGGGGGVSYNESEGNVDIKLKPVVETDWIIQSPDFTYWHITVNDDGSLTATSGAAGTLNNLKVTKPDLSLASFAVTDLGEIQVISPAAGGMTLDDNFYIESPDGTAFKIKATDDDEIQTSSDETLANHFAILDDNDKNLFRIQEIDGKAVQYLPVFTSLPASPPSIDTDGVLPWAFYDSGSFTRPVFYDGSDWRYFHDNSTV